MAIIQEQFKNTNIEKLLRGLEAVFDKWTLGLIDSIKEEVLSLPTARGIGLDMWGKLLGFPRYLPEPVKSGATNTIPFNFENKDYFKLQFYQEEEGRFKYVALDDFSYRVILQSLTVKLTQDCTIPKINQYCDFLFSKFGGASFCQDSHNMRFVTYILRFEIPSWLRYIIETYDILPRPTGVAFRYIESAAYPIGFRGQSTYYQTQKKNVTNFYRGRFANEEEIQRAKLNTRRITHGAK